MKLNKQSKTLVEPLLAAVPMLTIFILVWSCKKYTLPEETTTVKELAAVETYQFHCLRLDGSATDQLTIEIDANGNATASRQTIPVAEEHQRATYCTAPEIVDADNYTLYPPAGGNYWMIPFEGAPPRTYRGQSD